jgi:hypothetical protein
MCIAFWQCIEFSDAQIPVIEILFIFSLSEILPGIAPFAHFRSARRLDRSWPGATGNTRT